MIKKIIKEFNIENNKIKYENIIIEYPLIAKWIQIIQWNIRFIKVIQYLISNFLLLIYKYFMK